MGSFDDIIRQEIAARGNARMGNVNRGDPSQEARDSAARRINVRERGVNSTAYPAPGGGHPTQLASSVPSSSLPNAAPVPMPRPIDDVLNDQVGDGDVPLPQARPNPNAMEMGDANVMQAALGNANIQNAMASLSGVPDNVGVNVPGNAPAPAPTADAGVGGGYVALLASIGGLAGAAQLYRRWQLGDADAARTFAAVGIDPNDFSAFAQREAAADRRSVTGGLVPGGSQPAAASGAPGVENPAAAVAGGGQEAPAAPPGLTPEEDAQIRAQNSARDGASNPPSEATDAGKGDREAPKGKKGKDGKGPRVEQPSNIDQAISDSLMSPEERLLFLPAQGNPADVTEPPSRYRKPPTSTEEIIREAVKMRPKVKVKK